MSKRYAVSYIDWYDHDLTTVIVEAKSALLALNKHPKIDDTLFDDCITVNDAKVVAFDADCMVESVEIPE